MLDVKAGAIEISDQDFPYYLYSYYETQDSRNALDGLLRGELLVRVSNG